MEINEEKINQYIKKGFIEVKDNEKFKYIVEILRLFKIKVNGWMKGSYILNEEEGIMFIKTDSANWNDEIDNEYMYEFCKDFKGVKIAKRNDYWGDKKIYVFQKKSKEGYEFIGCFRQDDIKIEELFKKGIIDKRPYKKIGDRIDLNKF